MSLTAQDEHNKNEGALTTRTIKRIDGESAATPPEPPAVARVMRVIRVKMRLQELSDSITQYVEATTGTFQIPGYSSSAVQLYRNDTSSCSKKKKGEVESEDED